MSAAGTRYSPRAWSTAAGFGMALAVLLCLAAPVTFGGNSPWGADYFPNVELVTHEGERVRFFDDLIEDKVVVVNFIYTSCPDVCPLETAQLVKVQNILGERIGRDVFFYSISIDPETDTPSVLARYRDQFGARWTFLTGTATDIVAIRKSLGLYIEEIQDGSNNHNLNMIIGNQSSGRWMKRSPFENPYVLADQVENWLTDWKRAQPEADYASAPELRDMSRGEQIFRTRCATCHALTGQEAEGALGPDLLGVAQRRDLRWLLNWLRAPDQMLRDRDPIAMELYKRYNKLAMPNLSLNREEALALIEYIDEQPPARRTAPGNQGHMVAVSASSGVGQGPAQDVVAVMNAWVAEAHPVMRSNAGYMTLVNTGAADVTLVGVESALFERVEIHEMVDVDGLSVMRATNQVRVPAGGQLQFQRGGAHLMLIDPRKPASVGERVDLTLVFDSGRRQSVTLEVLTGH